ncbi:MAG: VanW family protein [Clostridia bacterium]|nr:VanW family protein [Clostridia bacterium]
MTQTPQPGRNRRTQRPADITPARTPHQVQAERQNRSARQPIGRSEELLAREAQLRKPVRSERTLPSYSDFDQPILNDTHRKKAKQSHRRDKHTALWLMVALLCLLCTGALAMFVAPQVLGVTYAGMPNYAFVNGSVIRKDVNAIQSYETYRRSLQTDLIHNGVYIDGIHVGGMTKQQAIDAVGTVAGNAGSSFAITVSVAGYTWSIDSDTVPLYRDTEEVVQQAYAIGRSNTTAIRGTTITPFRQRLNSVQAVWQQPVAFYTTTTYDHDVVRAIVDGIAQSINRDPVNASVASFNQETKKFTFNSDESGVFINADDIYNAVVTRLDSGVYYDALQVEPQILLADVTKAELMNSFGLISSFTTSKTGNTNRTTNIALSANAINGTTVLPGETFSFNQATGQRTEAKGYKAAAAIAGGETFDEIGGGVCQTSTTLFNAVARANLTIVDRDPHAWPSDYVPKGEDATVNWPNLDFRFRNDSSWPVFIVASCNKSKKTVTVEIYGMSLGDGVTIDLESEVTYTKKPPTEPIYQQNPELPPGTEKTTVKARTGYTVETYKVWYRNGQEFKREKLHTSNYKMYQQVIEWN